MLSRGDYFTAWRAVMVPFFGFAEGERVLAPDAIENAYSHYYLLTWLT